MPVASFLRVRTSLLVLLTLAVVGGSLRAQERVDGAIQKHGFFQQTIAPEEISVNHGSEFKGAHKVAVAVFNVAFPSDNHFKAVSKGHSMFARASTSAKSSMSTTLNGVDQATRQRIADKAYALFVEQLTGAGYEVVDVATLAKLAPEYTRWKAQPNFSQGRFGTYVVPTGHSLYFLQGDSAKRDTSGTMGENMMMFRGLDRPEAFTRSAYIAHDAHLGIIAVTLVVDYGVYSSTGRKGFGKNAEVGFKPGVTIAAGNITDSGTLLEYWGQNSGGFPAGAFLQQPIRSALPFGAMTSLGSEDAVVVDQEVAIVADPVKFEAAADEVVGLALPKLVSVMTAKR